MYLSLSVFLIGDLVVINHDRLVFLVISILCYAMAKIFLSFRFVPKHDFNISRLFPLSILIFIYTMGMVSIVYENLGNLLIPSIVCFFLTLLLFQFAVLRRYAFNRFSYLSVLIGVILFILLESMMAIKIFKTELPFHNILTILFYGSSLYFIVIGIVNEKEVVSEDETDINFY